MFLNWDQGVDQSDIASANSDTVLDQGVVHDTTRLALEDTMHAGIFIVDGILTMLFFPIRLLKLVGVDSSKSRAFFFPLGNKLTFVPLLSLCMWLCVLGIGLQLSGATDPRNLRDIITKSVSIGDPIVAVTLFAGVACIVAAAVSHHPKFVRWDKQATSILDSVPFARRAQESVDRNALHRGDVVTTFADALQGDHITPRNVDVTPRSQSVRTQEMLNSTDRLLPGQRVGGGGPEDTPPRVGYGDEIVLQVPVGSNPVDVPPSAPPPPRQTGAAGKRPEFQTLGGPVSRMYIPFGHVLMDEIPPLTDSTMHFIYPSEEWFEPRRQNRQQLDRSLALFMEVYSEQQRFELNEQLKRRSQRGAGPPQQASVDDQMEEEMHALGLALISAETAEWKPSDLFKFSIGDLIKRNGDMESLEVSFDGLHSVRPGERFVVSNRMWHEDCALYCVEGGAESHQWQAIEALFDLDEEIALDGTAVNTRKTDRAVSTETLLLAMSGRDLLRRLDVYHNGNIASSETSMYIPPWLAAVDIFVCIIFGCVPLAVRVLQGGGLNASGTLGDILSAHAALVLSAFAGSCIMVFLSTTLISLSNFDDAMDSFTEVTLGSSGNKWYPVMNWYETVNMRTWYHLREHISTTYLVHYNARLSAVFCVLMLASSWSFFCMSYCLTYAQRSRPTADGWVLQITLFSLMFLVECHRIFDFAVSTNQRFLSHRFTLAEVQVSLEEELMLVAARTVNKSAGLQAALLATQNDVSSSSLSSTARLSQHGTTVSRHSKVQGLSNATIAVRSHDFQLLLDAKALLEDLRFAVDQIPEPLIPFGVPVNKHLVQYIVVAIAADMVALALILAGMVLNSWRWQIL